MNTVIETCYGIVPYIRSTDGTIRYIAVTQREDHTGFPKGHPEKEETPVETALRELKEETGITNATIIDQTPLVMHYTFTDTLGTFHEKTVQLYLAEIPEQTLQIPEAFAHEISSVFTETYQDIRPKLTYENAKVLLDEARARLGKKYGIT